MFALGAAGGGASFEQAAEPELKAADERILHLLQQEGRTSLKSIAEQCGLAPTRVKSELASLVSFGKVVTVGKARSTAYELAPAGFKGWLRKKGQTSAEGRAKVAPKRNAAPKATTKTPTKAKAPLKQRVGVALAKARPALPAPAAAPAIAEAPAVECGLFSSGAMQIDANGQSLRLDRGQARAVIDWLLKIDAAMRP